MKQYNHNKYKAFTPIALKDRTWPDKVITRAPIWCSVDLRDGNQALIEPMSVDQKQQMFRLLVDVGFKEIEIGFPAASQPDFDFCRWLIEENQVPEDVTIQVLTQARPEIIQRTFEALKGAPRAIVHLYNSTSTVQREKVFRLGKDGIRDIAVQGAREFLRCAAEQPSTEWIFQYSPESFTGTELDYAVEVCNAVTEVWQPTPDKKVILNLPATVEMATPNVYADQIEWFCRHVDRRDSVIISLHTHNDRGCGVAAAELAVMAGADRVEGTLLGNGERTGNMDVVVMGMNLYSQGIDPELDFSDMDKITSVVKACTQIDVHPRQAYSGSLVYTAFSGSHQDAIKKCLETYEEGSLWEIAYLPIDPRDVGRTYQDVIRVNSQSGKGGVAYVMDSQYGYKLPRWLQIEFSRVVQKSAEDSGQEVSGESIWNLFQSHYLEHKPSLVLKSYRIDRNGEQESITGVIEQNGRELEIKGQGKGTLQAFVDGLQNAFGMEVQVQEFDEHALNHGTTAEAVSYVQVKHGEDRHIGIAVNEDVVSATVDALLRAVTPVVDNQNCSREAIAKAG